MNFWTGIILAAIFLILTVIIFATKFLFPHHRILALSVYAIGWIPFVYSILLKKEWLLKHHKVATSFISAFWPHIVFGLIMLVALFVFLTLFPPIKSPFHGMEDEEIIERLEEDEKVILYLNQRLSSGFDDVSKKGLFKVDFKNISQKEKDEIEDLWASYIEVLLELDLLKERYKTFYQLNIVTKKDLNQRAFVNGYASFLAQHHHVFRLTQEAKENPQLVLFLNGQFSDKGIPRGTYDNLQKKLTDPREILRLNTGRAYYKTLSDDNKIALNDLVRGHLDTVDESLKDYTKLVAKRPVNFLERNSFKLWFPVQKEIAINISYIKVSDRDYHINAKQIGGYKDKLLPGDILLERREWHATNVGIPGFWTHAALYLGDIDKLNSYFKGLPELGSLSFEDFLKESNPTALEALSKKDKNGYSHAVIESKRPGVIIQSLEDSANADSLGVLRVKGVSKAEQLKVVTQALKYFGRPYDFNFDFLTDETLVCSELIYKAYWDVDELTLEPKEFNGRLMISPNDFAKKFTEELSTEDSQLEVVLFLDGNEKTSKAVEKDAESFKETWERPKWYIVEDYK